MSKARPPGPKGVVLAVDGNWRHGTPYAYSKRGCRCAACCEANRLYNKESRDRKANTPPPSHGVSGFVTYRCRCEVCRGAYSLYQQRRLRANNARSQDQAFRKGSDWTGPELETLARRELTAEQIASMVGRTVSAVQTMRAKMILEPVKRRLLGHGHADTPPPR